MNLTKLKHRTLIAVPFCYIAFLLFGVTGIFIMGDVGHMIIIITVLVWILNKMIAEAFTAVQLWHEMNTHDKK